MLEDEVALLRQLPLLAKVDPARLKVLCFASARESFEPGEVLFRAGDPATGAYVILSGTVEVRRADGSHSTRSGSHEAVSIVGQSSMLSSSPRHATVTALTPVEVLRINSSCFMQVMTSCCKSSEGVIRSLGAQLGENDTIPAAGWPVIQK